MTQHAMEVTEDAKVTINMLGEEETIRGKLDGIS